MTLSELFTNIANAIRGKDGTTATITPTDFASRISAIETGVDTSDATATASDMANGVTAYVNGEKVTGNVATFQLDPCHIADSIRQSDPYIVMTKSNNPNQLYRAGTGISVITDKSNFGDATAADVASGKTFTSSAGLKVTGSLSEVTQATPGISVSSSGLITASVTQSGGIVTAGTKSATKQLTTQAAKTVTPGASSQTAVNSGVYTTGAVTVSGDSNLVAGNIKSGVSIFGVAGSLTSGTKSFSLSHPAEHWGNQLSFANYSSGSRTYTNGALIISPSNLNGTINKVECVYIEGYEAVGGASAEGWYGNTNISISGFTSKATVGYVGTNGGSGGEMYAIVSTNGTKIALVVDGSYMTNYFPNTEPIVIHVLYS